MIPLVVATTNHSKSDAPADGCQARISKTRIFIWEWSARSIWSAGIYNEQIDLKHNNRTPLVEFIKCQTKRLTIHVALFLFSKTCTICRNRLYSRKLISRIKRQIKVSSNNHTINSSRNNNNRTKQLYKIKLNPFKMSHITKRTDCNSNRSNIYSRHRIQIRIHNSTRLTASSQHRQFKRNSLTLTVMWTTSGMNSFSLL